jgi:hypothetical protein
MAFSKSQHTSAGLREALRFLKAPKRKPTDADRPPPSSLPGRRARLVDGQLGLEERSEPDDVD